MRKMKKTKKSRLLLVIVLVFALLVPQGVFASTISQTDKNKSRLNASWRKPGAPPPEFKGAPLPEFKPGEVFIKTNGKAGALANILRKYKLTVLRSDKRLGYVLAATSGGADVPKLVSALQREPAVRYSQPNYIYKLFGKPNDPQYSRQWGMQKINFDQGWSLVKPGSKVTVAILDTGVDVNHPDLKNRLVPGTNTVNPLKSTRDDVGHGTHVAGIAGAGINNGQGIAGVAGFPNIKIMPVKVFDGSGGGSDISISDGIIWAADHGARVMNMSFGSYYQSDVLNEAIDYAYKKGVVMVAAAGNWASQDISYPAAISKVMAVSATDKDNKLADFSSYGPMIDVCAPGDKIYSTFWDPYKGSTYSEMSGTSMASPMVAGLAALLLAKNPKLTNDEVRQIIEASATDLGDPGWDPKFGHGMINVAKALSTSLAKLDDANGTVQKAVYLINGVSQKGKIDYGSDIDWYKIDVPDKSSLQVEVLPAGKVTPGVEIYDGSEELVESFNTGASSEDGESDEYDYFQPRPTLKVAEAVYGLVTDLDGGEYYIKVFGNHFRWSEDDYVVTARVIPEADLVKDLNEPNDSPEEAKKISVGTPVSGAILSGDDQDWFEINLTSKAYRVKVDVPEGLDLAVDIELKESSSEGTNNEYDYGGWYSDTINNGGLGQDEDGVIVLPEGGAGTYLINVYETSGGAVNSNYTLTITGFTLKPDKYEPNDTWERASRIELREEITANFDREEDEDWFQIRVDNTGILKIDLQEPQNTYCQVELYSDPEAEPVGERSHDYSDYFMEKDKPLSLEFKVNPGNYYLNIYSWDRLTAEDYKMKTEFKYFYFVDQEPNDKPSQANEITLNVPKQGTLYPDGDIDYYVLNVEKPQPFLVYITPPADLDMGALVMKEIKPDEKSKGKKGNEADNVGEGDIGAGEGNGGEVKPEEPLLEPVTEIDSGDKGQVDTGVFVPTKPGKYYIAVAALEGKSTGLYSIRITPFVVKPDAWEYNGTIAQAKPLTSGVSIRPTFMGTEDLDWFKIYVPGKGKLEVKLTVPSDIDGVIEIYDTAGKYLTKIDQAMTGEEEGGTIPVLKKGYYYIKAYDYLGNSSVQPYTLNVKYVK